MNISIESLIDYEGPSEGLDPVVEAICDVLVQHGFASDDPNDLDGVVRSMVVVRESPLARAASEEDFVRKILESKPIMISVPAEEKEASSE